MSDEQREGKFFECTSGNPRHPVHATVFIPGIDPSAVLKPAMAEQAARTAFGHRLGVTVKSNDKHWYRLFLNSHTRFEED